MRAEYKNVQEGKSFWSNESKWRKRPDGLGADLLYDDGTVNFLCGRRHIKVFKPEDEVRIT